MHHVHKAMQYRQYQNPLSDSDKIFCRLEIPNIS